MTRQAAERLRHEMQLLQRVLTAPPLVPENESRAEQRASKRYVQAIARKVGRMDALLALVAEAEPSIEETHAWSCGPR